MIHLDTTLLVDLLREARKGGDLDADSEGFPAHRFLTRRAEERVVVSVFTVCELMAGAACAKDPDKERKRVASILGGLTIAYPDARFAGMYAALFAELRSRGEQVPAFDLLIATAASLDDAPLVTRNTADFERIPGLRVLSY